MPVSSRRWTKSEFYRLGELGLFQGQRVELIEGELMVQSPQGAPHFFEVDQVFRVLDRLIAPGFWVRAQGPLDLGQTTEPEPDVSVIAGSRLSYQQAHPTSAVLIVEVSESTLSYDRSTKASLYAAGGVADYWIINLVDRQVEVYRDPVPDATQPFGYRYASQTVVVPPASIAPLALPATSIPVADLLS